MKLSRLKHFIKLYLPYKCVLEYEEKRDFFAQLFAGKDSNPSVEFETESKWENIISVSGFGYSGSGAIIDLLREYDECLVHGMAEGGSKAMVADDDFGEIKLLQYPGGLIDIDTVIETQAKQLGDSALKRFAKLAYRDNIFNMGPQYREYFFMFFDAMTEDVMRGIPGSVAAIIPRIRENIFTLRDYNKNDYFALCRQFLYSLFNLQYREGKKYLVLDQVISTPAIGVNYCRNFIPNMKNVVVWRDPRDIYTIVVRQDIHWFPHDTVEHFIKIMTRRYANLNKDSKEYLAIRFEDLIFDYDNTVAKVEEYLNLGEHKRPQSCLDISISCKNVGMWKTATDISQEDYDKIRKALPQFCLEK